MTGGGGEQPPHSRSLLYENVVRRGAFEDKDFDHKGIRHSGHPAGIEMISLNLVLCAQECHSLAGADGAATVAVGVINFECVIDASGKSWTLVWTTWENQRRNLIGRWGRLRERSYRMWSRSELFGRWLFGWFYG